MNKKMLGAGLVIATSLLASISPAFGDIGVTVVPGTRAASATDLVLPEVNSEHVSRYTSGAVTLWADDSTGSGAGWAVTVQADDFTGPGAIPAANLSAYWAAPVATIAGQPVDADGGPDIQSSLALGPLDQPRTLMQAFEGFGMGTYSQQVGLLLKVPADTLAGSYTTELTVSITAAP
ncbi:MAG: hypothetical protein QOI95_323 [Acidimicrobiaceae bacterium]|jgi:hypothetical protein